MQNAAFAAAGIDACYMPLAIPPDRIRRAIKGLGAAGFSGFNVTVPYKETVLPFMARLSPEAASVGAVNTIVARPASGHFTGHNTDVYGFKMLLRRAGISFEKKDVLILGAGGAAKAVCVAILPAVRSLHVLNRTLSRARRLRLNAPKTHRGKIFIANLKVMPACHLIVNATSLGLSAADELPLPRALLGKAQAAVDLIYNPQTTKFLRRAQRAGCRTANGLDMLLYQGARAFELWTGRPAPVPAMRRALMRELG